MAVPDPEDWPLLAKCRGMNDALFPEGKGDLLLTDGEAEGDERGVTVQIKPGRKLGKRLSMLSGGERALAAIAFPWFVARDRSLDKAHTAYDYLVEDQTRLLPAAAFEVAGASLLGLAGAAGATRASGSGGGCAHSACRGTFPRCA